MKRILWIIVLFVISASMFSSCASIFGNQKLTLKTTPSNADIVIKDADGKTVEVSTTPKEIILKGKEPFSIEVNKNNYIPERRIINKKFNHAFWLNFLVSGISIGGGLLYNVLLTLNLHFLRQANKVC